MRLEEIEIKGEDIKGLKMHYELPAQWLGRTFPILTLSGQDTACSGCIIPLFSALRRLADENRVFRHPLTISLGTAPAAGSGGAVLAIGQCPVHDVEAEYGVGGCPPSRDEMEKTLLAHTERGS
jgi:hypothetical protein